MIIPAELQGKWAYDKAEGFDGYLAAKGVPWLVRKIILVSGHIIDISKNSNGLYVMDQQMSKKSSHYEFTLDTQFEGVGFDGATHKILFHVEGVELTEVHNRVDKPDEPAEIYTYSINEEGKMIQKMQCGSASCKRIYKRK